MSRFALDLVFKSWASHPFSAENEVAGLALEAYGQALQTVDAWLIAMSAPAMEAEQDSQRTIATTRLVLVMIGIFACGCIVGGAITRAVSRYQWRMAMKNPESLASRISPQIVHAVGLREEQLNRVKYLINKRYDRMQALRAETYPLQLAEFDHLCSEIDKELDDTQRAKWAMLVKKLKNEYLPQPPTPPTADFIFKNFDANDDNILEGSELPPPMWIRVRKSDSDGDGKVTRSEFEVVRSRISP